MDIRALLIVPTAVAVALLAGCGLTGSGDAGGADSTRRGSAEIRFPAPERCRLPLSIPKKSSDELCGYHPPVDDDLSPIDGIRGYLNRG